MMTIGEAAKRAGMSDKTLRRAIEAGNLVAQPRSHSNQPILIDEQDLERYMASRQAQTVNVVQPASSLDQDRLSALEETVQRMQDDYRNDQLLGAGYDPLALTAADDAYYETRMGKLERQITELEARVRPLEVRFEAVHELLAKVLVKVEMPVPIREEARVVLPPVEPTEITPSDIVEKRSTKRDEPSFTLADFSQGWQPEYRCNATHGDVKATWILKPYLSGGPGEYIVAYCDWDKVQPKGRVKPGQKERGEALKETLVGMAIGACGQAGWIVTHRPGEKTIYAKKDK